VVNGLAADWLFEEHRRGTLAAGRLADIVAYPADPFRIDLDHLADLTPTFTMVGGQAVHDPGGLLGT
jgi:predicted amidohydrolase YtcJ